MNLQIQQMIRLDFNKRQLIQRLFLLPSQVASGKLFFIDDVAINTTPTFVVPIKDLGQSKIVNKAGVTFDVGAQISPPGDSQIKPPTCS